MDPDRCRPPRYRAEDRGSGNILASVHGDASVDARATGRRTDGIRVSGEQPVRVCERREIVMTHADHMKRALAQARKSYDEGGLPIGAVMVVNDTVVASGHSTIATARSSWPGSFVSGRSSGTRTLPAGIRFAGR